MYSVYFRFEVHETEGSLTLVAQRSKGTLGHVSLFVYAQNLEAQLGLDYVFTPMVKSLGIIVFWVLYK